MTERTLAKNVYRMFDANGDLLYVGMGAVFTRIYEHMISTGWFEQVVRVDIDHFDSREEARLAEARQIQALKPKYNKLRNYKILSKGTDT